MDARDTMELKEEAIRAQYPAALGLISGFDHAPRIAKPADPGMGGGAERSPGIGARPRFRSTVPGMATRPGAGPGGLGGGLGGSVGLIARVEAMSDGLVSSGQAAVLNVLRRALAISLAMGETFAAQSGLAELKRANLEGRLPETRRVEFGELLQAEALAVLYSFGNATAFLIAPHLGSQSVEIGEVEEVLTDNALLAVQGALWELDQDIALLAGDDGRLVAVISAFAEALMQKVALRAGTAARIAGFAGGSWKVEAEGLTLAGFRPARAAKGGQITMAFKKPHEVVGNHIAKYQSLRLAKMLMAYDFERRLNPFAELGGFIFTFMGDGKPGTGKTTLIQMMAGLLNDYCQIAGYPFHYQNFSIDQIDSYQGKSGQNARAFIDAVLDPGVIGFGTIDDIDQVAGKRGDRQSSAGQQEVTAVFMGAFAGAGTVVRGNCTFGMFSNHPENVDDALRQRAGARFLVDGPQTREDYIDILSLLLGKNHAIPLGEHDLFAAQEISRAVQASYDGHSRPHEAGLVKVWEEIGARLGPLDTIAKIGAYLKAIQQADERFTGRAIKNITDAVKVRAMDFELPDEWMEAPDLFLFKPYEDKLAMIRSLMTPITTDMVIQEINRYADSEFRYADTSDETAIQSMIRGFGREAEAKRRWLEGRG